jgi:lactate racemase
MSAPPVYPVADFPDVENNTGHAFYPVNSFSLVCSMAFLYYGNHSSVEIDLAEDSALGELGTPRREPLADPGAATKAALGEPIDYPTLAQSTTPVDRVVIALDPSAPQIEQVTAAVLQVLFGTGIDPDGITILQAKADDKASNPCRLVASAKRKRITMLVHDPNDRRQLAYLAADETGEAIMVNRALHEADVILPIGCIHGDETAGYYGIHSAVYPTFSDTKTLQRYRGLASLNGRGARRRELTAQVDHVAMLLGVFFTIQIVPGGGGQILHVLAGQSDSVRRRGRELYHVAWDCPVSSRASLVVAGIGGGDNQQTWENLGQALQVAGRFVEEGGAVAVCCDLAGKLGPAMQLFSCTSPHETALRHIGKERPVDALPAAQLAQALDRTKVYLLSRLDPSDVEDLDMIPIGDAEELSRLAKQHSSCVLLSNAPFISATEEDAAESMKHEG